jgi:C-5 cytosine-specific DNA methylase
MFVIDLYCGLGGWTEGFLAEGFTVYGFDIKKHEYGDAKYPAQLIIQNVLTLSGRQFKDAAAIVASPPCQEFAYRAQPWKSAKAETPKVKPIWWSKYERTSKRRDNEMSEGEMAEWIAWKRAHPLPPCDLDLFNACFRIQREACEAAGRHIPMVVENVRGAEPWVGRAAWHFGSYYLWGDVPALMPMTKARKLPGLRFDGSGKSFQSESVKVTGLDWSKFGTPSYKPKGFNVTAAQNYREGIKVGGTWFGSGNNCSLMRRHSSKSDSRKAASAAIAKIPFPLARHIAQCVKAVS